MEHEHTSQKNGAAPSGLIAAATYLVFFLPNLLGKAGDPFIRYHQKQATGLALFGLVCQGAISVLGWWAGFLGLPLWPVIRLLVWALRALLVYLVFLGAQAAFAGEEKELPRLGGYAARLFS